MFLPAAFVAEYKDVFLPVLKRYWWIFITLLIVVRYVLNWDVSMNTNYGLLSTLLIFCGLVGFAYQFPKLNIKTDISYGVYIYHMTVVNALMALGFVGQHWTLWGVIGITCAIAWISTKTIGRLSLNKKKILANT